MQIVAFGLDHGLLLLNFVRERPAEGGGVVAAAGAPRTAWPRQQYPRRRWTSAEIVRVPRDRGLSAGQRAPATPSTAVPCGPRTTRTRASLLATREFNLSWAKGSAAGKDVVAGRRRR